jgi:neutral ceramidase
MFGEVIVQPPARVIPGATVSATFVGAYPNNDLHRRGSYLEVQRREDGGWTTVADDGDWSTRFHFRRYGRAGSQIVTTWDVPDDAAGTYRITYSGDARDAAGRLTPIGGATREFTVAPTAG